MKARCAPLRSRRMTEHCSSPRTRLSDGPHEVMQSIEQRQVCTTCPYCGVGCGVLMEVGSGGSAEVRGDPDHPSNYGRLCSKGAALAETIDLEGRLLYPEIYG